MEHFVEFITNHWILSSLVGVIFVAYVINEFIIQNQLIHHEVNPSQAIALMNHKEAVVIDIRNESNFKEGHIVDSLSIPEQQLSQKMKSLQKYATKPIIVVCNVGQSAKKATALLKENGFSQARILSGGIQNWRAAGLPLVKS